jgi:pectin methylesterase-like acyl-CoA thioesterase
MNIKNSLFTILLSSLAALPLKAQVFNLVVAKDGSGNYTTIQKAINKVTNSSSTRTLIFIKNGTYNEKVDVPATKTNVSLVGENVDSVIITYNDYSGKTTSISTATSYTLAAEAVGFYAENLTIKNSSGDVGQAVALLTSGDQQAYKNCKIYGFQDTYYALKGRQYNLNCYVEGATDFIFGNSTSVFDSCTINCVSGGQYISAPSDAQLISYTSSKDTIYHGLLFNKSSITANSDVDASSYYLGRTWAVPGSSIYKNCTLGSHINSVGWYDWNGTKGRYGEYKSVDSNGSLVDVSGRADWSVQLSDEYATNYYNLDSFFCKSKVVWNPIPMTVALDAPANLTADQYILNWTAVTGALGYAIVRNDSVIGFSTTNSYTDTTVDKLIENTYAVKSVNTYGNLSLSSEVITVTASPVVTDVITKASTSSFKVYNVDRELYTSDIADVEVYTVTGVLVKTKADTQNISLESLVNGFYLVKAINKEGVKVVTKIVLE